LVLPPRKNCLNITCDSKDKSNGQGPAVTLYTTRFNIQELCIMPTECALFCFVWFLKRAPGVFPYTAFSGWVFRHGCKIAKSDCYIRHVCPSVLPSFWNNSAPTGRTFMKLDVSLYFETLDKIQVLLKSDKNRRYITWRSIYIYGIISLSSPLN
jgi:hypothetical protein